MKPIVEAICMSTRLISVRLCNNEIKASNSDYIRRMIQNHPSLTAIDFSNGDS